MCSAAAPAARRSATRCSRRCRAGASRRGRRARRIADAATCCRPGAICLPSIRAPCRRESAHAQGIKLAEELLRRHLQDHGDWPKGLVVDLWGSATMRTAGEEFAMALHLAGIAPRWDASVRPRLTGFEIIPLAQLGRPRIDVTLRVSGLFRDVFSALAQLFEAASRSAGAARFRGRRKSLSRHAPRACSGRVPGNMASA